MFPITSDFSKNSLEEENSSEITVSDQNAIEDFLFFNIKGLCAY